MNLDFWTNKINAADGVVGDDVNANDFNVMAAAIKSNFEEINGSKVDKSEIYTKTETDEKFKEFYNQNINNAGYVLKGFHPQSQTDTDVSSGKIVLDSVEGIEVGMPYNIFWESTDEAAGGVSEFKCRGKITAVDSTTNQCTYSCTKGDQFIYSDSQYTLPVTSDRIYGNVIINNGLIGSFDIEFNENDRFTFGATGIDTKAGINAHAEGVGSEATGFASHAEGYYTQAPGERAHAEGYKTTASGYESHSEGLSSKASGYVAHAEGRETEAIGERSHAEGYQTKAEGINTHSEGMLSKAQGAHSHSEGYSTTASGTASHAEGNTTTASGTYSHSEGYRAEATGLYSHAENRMSKATGQSSHAEGNETKASGDNSHSEGYATEASGLYAHSEGVKTKALKTAAHAEGAGTVANSAYQHVQGKYNAEDAAGKYAHIIGNGKSDSERSNAHTVDWNGNGWFAGTVEATSIILKSSTEGSSKRFKITVDDSGTLSATEIV